MAKVAEFVNHYLSKFFGFRLIAQKDFDLLFKTLTDLDQQLRGRVICEYLPNTPEIRSRVQEITNLIKPKSVTNASKVRVGNTSDGGYVCLNNFDNVTAAVSLGIKDDVTWDLDIAKRGIHVYQYDYTIDELPETHPNFHFYKLKVSAVDGNGEISLNSILRTNDISQSKSVFLKMDIEGCEWDALLTVSDETLNSFSQIVCELHDFNLIINDEFYHKVIKALNKLRSKFEVFHIHGNNCAPLLLCTDIGTIPQVLEIGFANKEIFTFIDSNEVYPTNLDSPCSPNLSDYRIDFASN